MFLNLPEAVSPVPKTRKQKMIERMDSHRKQSSGQASQVLNLLTQGADLFWRNDQDFTPQEMADLYDEAFGPGTAASLLATSSATIDFVKKVIGKNIQVVPDGATLSADEKTGKVTVTITLTPPTP